MDRIRLLVSMVVHNEGKVNKQEVAKYLGVSEKTVQRMVGNGQLKAVYIKGAAVFDIREVERLKTERETPVHRAIAVPQGQDLSTDVHTHKDADILYQIIERLLTQRESFLWRFEQLELAAEKGWVLPTSAIAQLIARKPKGEVVNYGSFAIHRAGRIGRETGWLVVREITEADMTAIAYPE